MSRSITKTAPTTARLLATAMLCATLALCGLLFPTQKAYAAVTKLTSTGSTGFDSIPPTQITLEGLYWDNATVSGPNITKTRLPDANTTSNDSAWGIVYKNGTNLPGTAEKEVSSGYTVVFKNCGYTMDAERVDLEIKVTKFRYRLSETSASMNSGLVLAKSRTGQPSKGFLFTAARRRTDDRSYTADITRISQDVELSFYKTGTREPINKLYQLVLYDIDGIGSDPQTNKYTEGIAFGNNFTNAYVTSNTKLRIDHTIPNKIYSKEAASNPTDGSILYSNTMAATMSKSGAGFTWYGQSCGTALDPVYFSPQIGIPKITGTAAVSDTLTATVTGQRGVKLAYQWSRATSSAGPFTNVTGATNTTYACTKADAGKYLRCTIRDTMGNTTDTAYAQVGPVSYVVSVTVPTKIDLLVHADGSVVVPTQEIQNLGNVDVRLHEIEIAKLDSSYPTSTWSAAIGEIGIWNGSTGTIAATNNTPNIQVGGKVALAWNATGFNSGFEKLLTGTPLPYLHINYRFSEVL